MFREISGLEWTTVIPSQGTTALFDSWLQFLIEIPEEINYYLGIIDGANLGLVDNSVTSKLSIIRVIYCKYEVLGQWS